MTAGTTPERLFAERLAEDPGSPLVTFYDDATGERAELSAKSVANWVAKTHFLLTDELGLGVGDRAFVGLPVHWLAAPVLFGCWSAGLEVVTEPTDAAVAFGDVDTLGQADLGGVGEVFAVSLLSMGRSDVPPNGMTDYASAVRPQPDSWPSVVPMAGPRDPALNGIDRAELVREARGWAVDHGLLDRGRLMWSQPAFGPAGWIASFLAPLTVNGSVVLTRNADRAVTAGREAGEQVTLSV
jgi:uncharacterized protein (TIGR03089 family)